MIEFMNAVRLRFQIMGLMAGSAGSDKQCMQEE